MIATTPLRPEEIMAGHMLFAAFRLLTSSAAFILVMEVFGVTKGWGALLVLPAALLTGLAFAAPLAAWTVTLRSYAKVNTVFRFAIMPMYMLSGTFFALSQLPRDEGVPKLMEVARTNRNPEVRKQAMFWLGQTKDPRAVKFFEDILLKK